MQHLGAKALFSPPIMLCSPKCVDVRQATSEMGGSLWLPPLPQQCGASGQFDTLLAREKDRSTWCCPRRRSP